MSDLAVVGAGAWGKNLVRNFYELRGGRTVHACDLDAQKLARLVQVFPNLQTTTDYRRILDNPKVGAVVVASNASGHHLQAKQALEAGKDVFVEKPMALRATDALELVECAESRGRILMVGHLMLFHPVTAALRQLVRAGDLGEVFYLYSQRLNLGQVRRDENVLWSFGPHDLSLIFHLLDQDPVDVSARGQHYLQETVEDVVFVSLNFRNRVSAHIHMSWLDPQKIRRLTVVGSRKMAVFDDVVSTEKLRIYDRRAEKQSDYDTYGDSITLRFGDIVSPHVTMTEPLRLECQHFLECVEERRAPRTTGRDGLRVVRVLEAAEASLRENGRPIRIGDAR